MRTTHYTSNVQELATCRNRCAVRMSKANALSMKILRTSTRRLNQDIWGKKICRLQHFLSSIVEISIYEVHVCDYS